MEEEKMTGISRNQMENGMRQRQRMKVQHIEMGIVVICSLTHFHCRRFEPSIHSFIKYQTRLHREGTVNEPQLQNLLCYNNCQVSSVLCSVRVLRTASSSPPRLQHRAVQVTLILTVPDHQIPPSAAVLAARACT